MMPILPLAAGFVLLICLSAYALLRMQQQQDKVAERLSWVQAQAAGRLSPRAPRAPLADLPKRLLAQLGTNVLQSGMMSGRSLADLRHTLEVSGIRSTNALPMFVASKLLLMILLPAVSYLLLSGLLGGGMLQYLPPLVAVAIALVVPDMAVRRIRNGYVKKVEGGLADALDMMVICGRAGMAMEPAMSLVSSEMASSKPEIAKELSQTVAEMQVGSDSKSALVAMGERTGLDSMRRLSLTLVQTQEYGTPLVDSLRGLATEMRLEFLTRAEERAARLPVMLTIPMILFILPCQFIIAAGPAAISMVKAFAG